jgi:hypothetical protein
VVTVDRIGLAVRSDAVSAVAMRRGAIAWVASASLPDASALESVTMELLRNTPRGRWRRVYVVAAIGPTWCQTRRLSGLPPLRDAAVAAALVRENIARFFLRNGAPLLSSTAVPGPDGAWWSAVFDEPVVAAIRSVCEGSGLRLEAVVPTVTILPALIGTDRVIWRDGETSVLARFRDGRLLECHRTRQAPDAPPQLPGALTTLGSEAGSYIDAYAAASLDDREHVPAYVPGAEAKSSRVSRWRLVAAATAAGVTAFGALVSPGALALVGAARAEAEAAHLEAAARQPLADEADLARVRAALAEFDALARTSARPSTHLLAELARVLPDSAAIVSVRLDSAGGQVVVLASRAATVLARLERLRIVANPRVTGPITRERVDGHDRERVTVSFERR